MTGHEYRRLHGRIGNVCPVQQLTAASHLLVAFFERLYSGLNLRLSGAKNSKLTHFCRQVTRQHRSGRHAQRATLRVTSNASGSGVLAGSSAPTASQTLS